MFIKSCSTKFLPYKAKGALLGALASPISTIASSDDFDTMESSVSPMILPMLLASSVAVNVMLFLVILRSYKKRDDAGGNGKLDWMDVFFAASAIGLSFLGSKCRFLFLLG